MAHTYAVKPVYNDHFWDHGNQVITDRWSFYKDILYIDHTNTWLLQTVHYLKMIVYTTRLLVALSHFKNCECFNLELDSKKLYKPFAL